MKPAHLFIALPIACLAIAPSIAAGADPASAEKTRTAQALYDEALSALDRNDFANACPKLEEVVALEPAGIGAKITLAECYERSGKLASAAAAYEIAQAAAAAAGQTERERKARDRAAALKPRLAHLTVVVPPEVRLLAGLEIKRDGVPVGVAQWGVALPLDRGEHQLIATASGKDRWTKAVAVVDGASLSITIGPLNDAGSGPTPIAGPNPIAAPTPIVEPTATDAPRGQLIAGIVVGSVGVVSAAIASAFGVMAINKKKQSDPYCPMGNACYSMGYQLRLDGRVDGNVSTAVFIAGGVALAAGVTLILTAPRDPRPTAEITLGPGRIAVGGAF